MPAFPQLKLRARLSEASAQSDQGAQNGTTFVVGAGLANAGFNPNLEASMEARMLLPIASPLLTDDMINNFIKNSIKDNVYRGAANTNHSFNRVKYVNSNSAANKSIKGAIDGLNNAAINGEGTSAGKSVNETAASMDHDYCDGTTNSNSNASAAASTSTGRRSTKKDYLKLAGITKKVNASDPKGSAEEAAADAAEFTSIGRRATKRDYRELAGVTRKVAVKAKVAKKAKVAVKAKVAGKAKVTVKATEPKRKRSTRLKKNQVAAEEPTDAPIAPAEPESIHVPEQPAPADTDIYEVERITGKRINSQGIIEYYIKWHGYEQIDTHWEPVENLTGSMEILLDYEMSEEGRAWVPAPPPNVANNLIESVWYGIHYNIDQKDLKSGNYRLVSHLGRAGGVSFFLLENDRVLMLKDGDQYYQKMDNRDRQIATNDPLES